MSVTKCAEEVRLEVYNHRPVDSLFPCFVGNANEYACFAVQKECGIDITELPENDETRPLIKMAQKYASHNILSRADLYKYVFVDRGATSLYDHFFDRIGGINRFMENAKTIVNKYLP